MAIGAEVADYENQNVQQIERPKLQVLEGGRSAEIAAEPEVIRETLLPLVGLEPVINCRAIFDQSMQSLVEEYTINQYFDQDYEPYLEERNIFTWELSQVQAGLWGHKKVSYGLGVHVKDRIGKVEDTRIFMFLGDEDEIQRLLISYKEDGEDKAYFSNFDSKPDLPEELIAIGLHCQDAIHETRQLISSRPKQRKIGQAFILPGTPSIKKDLRYF